MIDSDTMGLCVSECVCAIREHIEGGWFREVLQETRKISVPGSSNAVESIQMDQLSFCSTVITSLSLASFCIVKASKLLTFNSALICRSVHQNHIDECHASAME